MRLKTVYEGLKRELFKPSSPMPLCLFRIAFGLVALEYCFLIAPELVSFFSNTNGILLNRTLDKIYSIPVINLITLLPAGDGWLYAFFGVFSLACLFVTIGLFSRVSMIIVYLGLVSFLHRNIYVHHGGEHLLTIAAFWLCFSPIGAALSLDNVLFGKKPRASKSRDCSLWALKAYQLQFALVYWQASLSKLASTSWWDGTAMYYVFRHLEFTRFTVPFVPQDLFLLKLATWSSMAAEFCGWTLIWFKETRYAVLLILLALHLGIDYAMNIPIFEHVMIASLVAFIPGEDAEKFVAWVKKCAASGRTVKTSAQGRVQVEKVASADRA
ncbi:MAG: HTTM domain-containing protein [Cyanobacteria bacterium REEB67]|nr:HTTM domain-containing protein [Cyanobacteria bacterium REEB67]